MATVRTSGCHELHGALPALPRSQVAASAAAEQKRMDKNVGAAHYLLDLC